MVLTLLIIGIAISGLFFSKEVLGGIFGLYRVTPVNEAHIRILMNKKDVFSSRTKRTAYWYVPFITKLHKLPLCNLAIPINDIKLNDENMAKFVCDIMCFININNLELAVERLTLTNTQDELGFDLVRLSEDLKAIMESIGRTVTTKQTLLDIYMNRQLLDEAITQEVKIVFPKWGIELVDLELKDIKDAPNSTIIHDIERKVAAEINRDAEIKIAETKKEAELIKAATEEEYRKRQIEKDRTIAIEEQKKIQQVAQQEQEANKMKVEASRTIRVGDAEIEKEAMEQKALGTKIKLTIEAEGEALKIKAQGQAEADIIKAKKVAEAEGTEKLAKAMKEFDDTAINVKILDVQKDVILGKYQALATAMSKAEIKWILSGDNAQKFFGLNLDAEGGANLEQFVAESGINLEKLKTLINKVK
jgi:regulator of protease activity HflC (stomatin/prohibitin superfamily)